MLHFCSDAAAFLSENWTHVLLFEKNSAMLNCITILSEFETMFIRGVRVHVFILNHSILGTPLYKKHTVTTLMQSRIKGHNSFPVVMQHYRQVGVVEAFKFAAELVYTLKLYNNE